MAPSKEKTLTIQINSMGTGPNGVPLLFGAANQPAVISGNVLFENNYEAKGDDITIEYSAIAAVHWTTKSTSTTYSNGKATTRTTTHHHRAQKVYDEKAFKMALGHSKPGKITAGKYSAAVNVAINPSFPSSSIGTYGWMTYKVVATLHRKFPSTNVVRESVVWVLNTCLPRPEPGLPVSMSRFNGTFDKVVPYVCVIPSEVLYLAQKVPVTFKAFPTLNNGGSLTVVSAIVKLKQYTSLKAGFETKQDSKDVMNIAMNDGWPVPVHGQPWQRTIVVPLPSAPTLSPTTNADCYVKTHKLKLIMQVRIGNGSKKELRVEMPVVITGPRPPGEHVPSFDLNRYLSCLDSI
ncbi:hypothetical protein BGZ82_006570 [Podila clonocystis]|nr:hypothetical protein BGZ82_006570 [Podila clonocystis]